NVADFLASLKQKSMKLIAAYMGQKGLSASFSCAMRYSGQGNEIPVPLETETPTAAELCAAFEDEYRRLFGRIIPGGDIEVLSWQLRLSRQNWQVEEPPAAPTPLDVKATDNRPVFELRMDAHVNHSVFRREELQPGAQFGGPAIIVE